MFRSLLKCIISYSFVNLPIKSKYYHKQLPTSIPQIINQIKRQSILNQKCFLLQHLSQILSKDRKINLSLQHRKIISEQLNKWKGQSQKGGRFQHIATVAWVIKKLNLQKIHSQLLQQLKQRFINDQWYVNFDQSVKALQYFKDHPQSQQKIQILKKIQRNIGITLWNVNMKYYERISTALLQSNRLDSQLWHRMQQQILQNLDMQYQPKTICNIFKSYALAQKGHDVFYQMMEKCLLQGHFSQYNILNFKNISKAYDDSGEFFSLVVQTYAIANKSCGVILTPDFKDYVYENLIDKKIQYKSLASITKVIDSLQGFQFEPVQIKQIQQILLQKQPIRMTLQQIKQFYHLMLYKHNHIPEKIHKYIQSFIIKQIRSKFIPASQLVDYINYSLQHNLFLNQQIILKQTNKFLQDNFKYLYPEEKKYVISAVNETKRITNKSDLLYLTESRENIINGKNSDIIV